MEWLDPDLRVANGIAISDQGDMLRLDAMLMTVQMNLRKLLEVRAASFEALDTCGKTRTPSTCCVHSCCLLSAGTKRRFTENLPRRLGRFPRRRRSSPTSTSCAVRSRCLAFLASSLAAHRHTPGTSAAVVLPLVLLKSKGRVAEVNA